MQLITIPHLCPSCNTLLENTNGQLFCRNKTGCPAQTSKLLEGFCKKLKIKGFGAKTLETLEITSIVELYTLTKQVLVPSLSEKIADKLLVQIENSKRSSFKDFIKSLGIPLIGETTAIKIASVIDNPGSPYSYNILRSSGLGDKATLAFLDYRDSSRGEAEMAMALQLFTFQVEKVENVDTNPTQSTYPPLEVCVTGKIEGFKSRTLVAQKLSPFNITVKGSVTKDVKYLVCEDETRKGSSSYTKALAKGIEILTLSQLLDIVTNK